MLQVQTFEKLLKRVWNDLKLSSYFLVDIAFLSSPLSAINHI